MPRSLLLASVVAVISAGHLAAADARPNVLFIAVDDLNDWVGCLGGHPQASTPNIDRLAARGMLFTNAHCAAPLCNPSRTAVMTGRLPSSTGVHGNEQDWHHSPFLKDHSTLPRWFHDHGYRTAGCGKLFHANHGGESASPNGGHGGLQGFDDFSAWDERFPRKDRQLLEDAVRPGQNFNGLAIWHWDWGPIAADAAATADGRAVSWAMQQLAQTHDTPFFLAVGLYKPHSPWYVPWKYFDEQPPLNEIKLPEVLSDDLDDVPDIAKRYLGGPGDLHALLLKQNLWEDAVRAYLANIAFADAMVGRLLDALDASPHAKNTVVVVWSDHGWHLGEKQRWHKSTLWDEATRVPLIVSLPDDSSAKRCDRAVSLIDLYPTLCDLCEIPQPDGLDGASLVPLLKNPQAAGHPAAVTVMAGKHAAVRDDRWRFIRYGDGAEELYDHESDLHEWTNLASDASHDDVRARLAQHLPSEIRTFAEDHSPPNEPGFRPLFNGEDLTGWQAGASWSVKDGTIVGAAAQPGSKPLAWDGNPLHYFELRARYRLLDGASLKIRHRRPNGDSELVSGEFLQTDGDGQWHDLTLQHTADRVQVFFDGRRDAASTAHYADQATGAGHVSIAPPPQGRLELKDLRLREIGGR